MPTDRVRLLGALGFVGTLLLYLYYTVWVILTPFVDADLAWFHQFFPALWWAFAVPTALLVVGLSGVMTFVGIVRLRA